MFLTNLSANMYRMALDARLSLAAKAQQGFNAMFGEGGGGTGSSEIDVEGIINGASSISDGGSMSELTGKVDAVGGGMYHIVYRAAIFIFLVGIIIAGIMLFFSNSATRAEQKTAIIWKAVAIILAFGAVAIIVFLSTASNNIFG